VANTLLTPQMIADRAIATLYRDTVMSQLVHRDYENEFAKKQGDTITIRRPVQFTADEFDRVTGIKIQDIQESGISMSLNKFKDVSFSVTSEELTLTIDDFAGRYITPAVRAITEAIELDLIGLWIDIPTFVGTGTGEIWSTPEALIGARRELSKRGVPLTDRSVVVGATTAGEWLKADLLKKADARGDTQGLREASLGNRLFSFDAYEHNMLTVPTPQGPGVPTTEVGIAFHRDALALAIRPLAIPMGAKGNSAIANYGGLGIRTTYGYDIMHKLDVISLDVLYGCKVIDPNRAILIHGPLGT
jgi:hypothetical protein